MTPDGNGKNLQDKVPHRNHSEFALPSNPRAAFVKPSSMPTDGKDVSNVKINQPSLLKKIHTIPSNTLQCQPTLQQWMRPPTLIPTVKKTVTFARPTIINDSGAAKNEKEKIPTTLPLSIRNQRHNVNVLDRQTRKNTIKDLAKYGHLSKAHFHNGNAWNYSLFEDGVGLERFNMKPSLYSLITQPNMSVTDNCLQWIKARRYEYAKSNSTRSSDTSDNTLASTTGRSIINRNKVQSLRTYIRPYSPSLSLSTDDGTVSSGESDSAIVDCAIDKDGDIDPAYDPVGSSNAYRGAFKRCRYDYSSKGDPLHEVKPCYAPPSIGKRTVPASKSRTKPQYTRKSTSTAEVEDVNYKALFAKHVNAIFGSYPTRRDIKKDILVRPVPGISAKRIYGAGAQECDGMEISEFCNSITSAVNGPPRRPRNNSGPKPKEGNDGNRSRWDPMRIRMCSQHRACRSNTTKLGHKPPYLYYGTLKLSDGKKRVKINCGPLEPPLGGVFVVTGGEYPEKAIETFERSYKPEIELLFERGKPVEPWEVQEWQFACGLTREQLLTHKRASDRSDKINVGWFGERRDPSVGRPVLYPQHFHVLDPTKDILHVLEKFDEKPVKPHTKRVSKRNAAFGNNIKGISQWFMTIKDDEPDPQPQDQKMEQDESKQESADEPMFRVFDDACANYPGDFLETMDHSETSQSLDYNIFDIWSVGLRRKTGKGAYNGNNMSEYWQSKFLLIAGDDKDISGNGDAYTLDTNEYADFSDAEQKVVQRFQEFDSYPTCEMAEYLGARSSTDPSISLLDGALTGVAVEACENKDRNVTSKIEASGAQRSFALKVLLRFPFLDLRCFC